VDDVDKRLLGILADDARKPIKRIASEAGVSREVADYRIKKLEKVGVIGGYQARVNLQNYSSYFILIQLRKITKENEIKFLHFLRNVKYPHWIGRTSGEWDVLLSFSAKTTKDLQDNIDSIRDYFGNNLKNHLLLTITDSGPAGDTKLDEKDKQILKLLCENARITNKDIGRKVKLTSEAINYRIKNLEKKKILLGYTIMINYQKLGEQFQLMLKFSNLNKDFEKELRNYFGKNEKIISFNRSAGTYDFILSVFAEDQKDFNETLRELRNKFENLDEFTFLNILEVPLQRVPIEIL